MNRRQSNHLMMIIISLTILIIILTYFIEINSVVHGQGVITTKDNAQLISLSKGGTIQDIYVAEGDTVKKENSLQRSLTLICKKNIKGIELKKGIWIKMLTKYLSFLIKKMRVD